MKLTSTRYCQNDSVAARTLCEIKIAFGSAENVLISFSRFAYARRKSCVVSEMFNRNVSETPKTPSINPNSLSPFLNVSPILRKFCLR